MKHQAAQRDQRIVDLLSQEERRQQSVLSMIPSENIASPAVMQALGSVLMNKYAEGYPGKRYYAGNTVIDQIEQLAIDRAKALFGAEHANVQPYSGSPANLAVYLALLKPGDTVMGMSLPNGGHLTHGWKASITGKYFTSVQYTTDEKGLLDYDAIRNAALKARPRLIIAGATAYPRILDFAAFADIAAECGAYFLADISHIAGLVVGGAHPSPFPHADVVSTTTHKTLRGPRGAILMAKQADRLQGKEEKALSLATRIDRAVFPGLQGGPHEHTIAGIAVALHEASQPAFQDYAKRIIENAKVLAEGLEEQGISLVTGGTDNHLVLCDIQSTGLSGAEAEQTLESVGIIVNKNMIPNDPRKPMDPSGIRIGTPLLTSRGMGAQEMQRIANAIGEVLNKHTDAETLANAKALVQELTESFPLYPEAAQE